MSLEITFEDSLRFCSHYSGRLSSYWLSVGVCLTQLYVFLYACAILAWLTSPFIRIKCCMSLWISRSALGLVVTGFLMWTPKRNWNPFHETPLCDKTWRYTKSLQYLSTNVYSYRRGQEGKNRKSSQVAQTLYLWCVTTGQIAAPTDSSMDTQRLISPEAPTPTPLAPRRASMVKTERCKSSGRWKRKTQNKRLGKSKEGLTCCKEATSNKMAVSGTGQHIVWTSFDFGLYSQHAPSPAHPRRIHPGGGGGGVLLFIY